MGVGWGLRLCERIGVLGLVDIVLSRVPLELCKTVAGKQVTVVFRAWR